MPRLNNDKFIKMHAALRQQWLHGPDDFRVVPYTAQRAIFDFFVPQRNLNHEQLIAHREAISREQPQLPARANRAFHQLLDGPHTGHTIHRLPNGRVMTIRDLAEPELIAEAFAQALAEIARELDQAVRRPRRDPRRGEVEDRVDKIIYFDGPSEDVANAS